MLIKIAPIIQPRKFGRLKSIDPNDRDFPMRQLTLMEAVARTAPWNAPAPLDQGESSACTGFGSAHLLAAAPHMHPVETSFAFKIYDWARKYDEWEGEDYDGSSVRGAVKALVAMGCIAGGYWWAWDATTVKDYVRRYSPVLTGTDWYMDMMEPDKEGYIHPAGPMAGGHAYCILGYSDTREAFRIQNSWGRSWGQGGRAWIKFDDYAHLLERDGGEAVAAMEVKSWY